MRVDFHIHSIASGHAINTITEIIEYSYKKKMTHIAITDHGPSMEGAPYEGYFEISELVERNYKGMDIYMGVEANIIGSNGEIDLKEPYIFSQRLISAGLHEKTAYEGKTFQENTEAILSAIERKFIKIITHPWRECYPIDIETVTSAAINNKVLLEINNRIFRRPNSVLICEYRKMIELVKRKGYYVIVGSDAHRRNDIGNDLNIRKLEKELGLIPEIVINNFPKILEEFISEK